MKHEPIATANALAITFAVIFVVCRVLVGIFPDLMFTIAQSWLHGVDLAQKSSWDLTAQSFVLGLVSASVSAWLVGFLFASVSNYFAKKK
ncbi:hypothetical protein HZB69_04645 [Candidatus Amesbacteria bacterium]|nr:hypothetical protein [Candidatus Amesbacteria bacterium]